MTSCIKKFLTIFWIMLEKLLKKKKIKILTAFFLFSRVGKKFLLSFLKKFSFIKMIFLYFLHQLLILQREKDLQIPINSKIL